MKFNNSRTVISRLHYFEIEVVPKILTCCLSREHFCPSADISKPKMLSIYVR